MNTLEDACKNFYYKGFISFEFLTEDSGIVKYKDGNGNIWESLEVIENGRRIPKKIKKIS